ncbi:MAG TPA: hypothetical protein PK419_11015, partial [Spirochaetota bacterium]|nr:hypothetical protein [Spirochaetota bacterium]
MRKHNWVSAIMLVVLINILSACTGYNSVFYDEEGLCEDYVKTGGDYEDPSSDKRKYTVGVDYIGKRKIFWPFSEMEILETDDDEYDYELNGEIVVNLRFRGYNGYSLKSFKYKLINQDTNEELKEKCVYIYGALPFIKYNSIEESVADAGQYENCFLDVIYEQELFDDLENAEFYMEAVVSDGKEEITLKMNKKLHKEFSF